MNEAEGYPVRLAGEGLVARASGALWWPRAGVLAVADLHLGKAGRIARAGGSLLPPYGDAATLARLRAEVAATEPAVVVCLGDSFDDAAAAALPDPDSATALAAMAAGREWVWVRGNHDPGPGSPAVAGAQDVGEWQRDGLVFRHIATPARPAPDRAEVSGHFHPKARLALKGAGIARPCFLFDAARAILPAFGAYTGGLCWTAPPLAALMGTGAFAVLTGARAVAVPVPCARQAG